MPAMRLVSRAVTDFYTKSAFCNLIADPARPAGSAALSMDAIIQNDRDFVLTMSCRSPVYSKG